MKRVLVLIITTITTVVFGQQEYSFTNYFEVNSFYNPAAAGSNGGHNIAGLFRKQWAGFEGAPTTGGLVYNTRLESFRMGLGGYVFTDKVGATLMTNIAANYSYSLKLNDELQLAFGIDGGVDLYSTDYSRLLYWDNDNMFDQQNANNIVPRAGVGTHFYGENFYVGISVPRLLTFNNDSRISISAENLPSIVSNYYLSAGYKFELDPKFMLQTNVLGKYTPNVTPQGDINVMCTYKNTIGLGFGYKSLGFATSYLQYTYDNTVKIGYAFDLSLTEIANYSSGTHEVFVSYTLPTNKRTTASKIN